MSSTERKPFRTVELKFFEDDATGEWGTAPRFSVDHPSDNGFNAFWDGPGIFHDVFEHWQEGEEFFRDDAAMNIGGEMAAMGARMFFGNEHNLTNVLSFNNGWHPTYEVAIATTFGLVEEAVEAGYCNFGNELVSQVPTQPPTEEGELECMLEHYWERIQKSIAVRKARAIRCPSEREERKYGRAYLKTVTKKKINDLHRWGYRKAQEDFPDNWHNSSVLHNFVTYWKQFTKAHKAEELAQHFQYLCFDLYRNAEGKVDWTARFVKNNDPFNIFEQDVVIESQETFKRIPELDIDQAISDDYARRNAHHLV